MKTIIIVIVGAVLAACAFFAPSYVEQGLVRLDIETTKPVSVSYANVFEEDGNMVVRGTAKYPLSHRYGLFDGHIDVSVLQPDGKKYESQNVKVVRRRIPKTLGREGFFVTRFPIDPPAGTIVSIVYDINTHTDTR